jgi:hypothetical protein
VFEAIGEHLHGPGFDRPQKHVIADRLRAIKPGGALGRGPRAHGVEGQKCTQLGLAGLVFSEVMHREVHAHRIDCFDLLAAKGAHANPQPS